MRQQTLAVASDKRVRAVPWMELCAVIEPHYPNPYCATRVTLRLCDRTRGTAQVGRSADGSIDGSIDGAVS